MLNRLAAYMSDTTPAPVPIPSPQYVRSTAMARQLAERDARVRVVLAHSEYEPEALPGTIAHRTRQVRVAALTLVELYRLGFRAGWDGLKAYTQWSTTPGDSFVASAYAPDAAQVLALDAIGHGLAWPEQ